MKDDRMTIGKAAKAAGVGVETLRFYEREGIVAPAERTGSGYRLYDQESIRRIDFVHRAQALGFTLREIRELIALDSDPDGDCDALRARAVAKQQLIEEKIAQLERMQSGLRQLLDSCSAGQPIRNCPIMRCLTAC